MEMEDGHKHLILKVASSNQVICCFKPIPNLNPHHNHLESMPNRNNLELMPELNPKLKHLELMPNT